MDTLECQRVKQSIIVLANANEVVTHIVSHIAGNDISNTLNGSFITANMLRGLAQTRIKKYLDNVGN